jgi:thioredoxin 1
MKKSINAVLFIFSFCAAILVAETTNVSNSSSSKPAPKVPTKPAAPIDSLAMPAPPVDSSQQIADMIVNSKIPVLVDFWAVWCGPCRMLNPIIKQLEKDYGKKVLFVKVNVDVHRSIANYFSINSIPAVFIIKDKNVLKMLPGLQAREAYVAALDEVLNAPKADPEKPKADPEILKATPEKPKATPTKPVVQ